MPATPEVTVFYLQYLRQKSLQLNILSVRSWRAHSMAKYPLSQTGEWEQQSPVVQTEPAFTELLDQVLHETRAGKRTFLLLGPQQKKKVDRTECFSPSSCTFSSQVQNLALSFLELYKDSVDSFLQSESLWMAAHSSDVSPTPPSFVSSAKGAVCHHPGH